jgi:hypothetical protein
LRCRFEANGEEEERETSQYLLPLTTYWWHSAGAAMAVTASSCPVNVIWGAVLLPSVVSSDHRFTWKGQRQEQEEEEQQRDKGHENVVVVRHKRQGRASAAHAS